MDMTYTQRILRQINAMQPASPTIEDMESTSIRTPTSSFGGKDYSMGSYGRIGKGFGLLGAIEVVLKSIPGFKSLVDAFSYSRSYESDLNFWNETLPSFNVEGQQVRLVRIRYYDLNGEAVPFIEVSRPEGIYPDDQQASEFPEDGQIGDEVRLELKSDDPDFKAKLKGKIENYKYLMQFKGQVGSYRDNPMGFNRGYYDNLNFSGAGGGGGGSFVDPKTKRLFMIC